MERNAKITATGMYAPDRVVPNSYFNELLGEDVDTWLRENLTIRERRWCTEGESTADLVERCARPMLERAGWQPADLDLIVVSTDTPEFVSPSTASVVQHRLEATGAGTFDLNTACAGFVTALDLGAKYIQADPQYRRVMVIGAYAMSRFLDVHDKKTANLFADGAGGVLLEATEEERGWRASRLHTEGQYNEWMGIYAGGTRTPVTPEVMAAGGHRLQFVRKFPKEINPTTWARMVREVVSDTGHEVDDVAMAFFTQININSIRETMADLELPWERTHCVMDRYAYTGSACIPMCLAEADAAGRLKPGDLVVFMGSGGGLAFACTAFTW
ncbi:MAG: ketoacyl-ACP synthase III [bacterium]|nr:ketoacyl-ACP synthase III [bacterium]